MWNKKLVLVAGFACSALAAPALAQTIQVTQNTNNTVVAAGASVACAAGGGTTGIQQITTENHYWRTFNLNTFAQVPASGLSVQSVDFGVEQAQHPSGSQTVTVNLYKDTNGGDPVAVGNDLVLVSTAQVIVPNTTANLMVVNAPITGSFAKTDFLVVEIMTPDYTMFEPPPGGTSTVPGGENAVFFIGSNSLGQSGPAYLSTAACGVAAPTTTAGLGFPNMHVVMNVNGVAGGGTGPTCYANCDSSTTVPFLNVGDFICFQGRFAAGDTYANCDHSTAPPVLNVGDFICFQGQFAAGCSAP